MTKLDLTREIAEKTSLSVKDAALAVDTLVETIQDAVSQGDEVNISGFGKFGRKLRPARQGHNPRTGEIIDIAETYAPYFKPFTAFKEAIKGEGCCV